MLKFLYFCKMSLKVYKSPEIQDYKKEGKSDLLAGLQFSATYQLLHIYNAYVSDMLTFDNTIYDFSSTLITFDQTKVIAIDYLNAVKLSPSDVELESVSLPTNLIHFLDNQYLINSEETIIGLLNESIYYLTWSNGVSFYKTEPFLIKIMTHKLSFSINFYTFDSTILDFSQTKITI